MDKIVINKYTSDKSPQVYVRTHKNLAQVLRYLSWFMAETPHLDFILIQGRLYFSRGNGK